MHPEIARSIAAQHHTELRRQAGIHRLASRRRLAMRGLATIRLATIRLGRAPRRPALRLPVISLAGPRPDQARRPAAGAPDIGGVFLAGPEAFGLRTYLTPAEARQLAADWAELLAGFADRVDDPSRRPDGAVPFEVVVLGRQVPDLAGAGRGLTGPGQAG